ncbi:UNVERIFIED_CONTAM: hypothetical protein HDU68_012632 [Siphonaria sp. JEL0065]|nr:hypothetical protein HDU68_012632 [Siphonaria sp. JEL0065]
MAIACPYLAMVASAPGPDPAVARLSCGDPSPADSNASVGGPSDIDRIGRHNQRGNENDSFILENRASVPALAPLSTLSNNAFGNGDSKASFNLTDKTNTDSEALSSVACVSESIQTSNPTIVVSCDDGTKRLDAKVASGDYASSLKNENDGQETQESTTVESAAAAPNVLFANIGENTLESLMDKKLTDELDQQYDKLKTALLKRVDPASVEDAKKFFETFDSGTEKLGEYKKELDSFLKNDKDNEGADSIVSTVSASVGKFVDAVESIADVSLFVRFIRCLRMSFLDSSRLENYVAYCVCWIQGTK